MTDNCYHCGRGSDWAIWETGQSLDEMPARFLCDECYDLVEDGAITVPFEIQEAYVICDEGVIA